MLTEDILELSLEIDQEMKILPGQWALFMLDDENGPLPRGYSIVDQQIGNGKTVLFFVIKLLELWRGSAVIKAKWIGSEIAIKGIVGHFILQNTEFPKVFIWTWVGIAPLLNMAKYCTTKKQLFFSVPYKKDLFYEEKIKNISDLEYHIYLSRESVEGYHEWRIDLSKISFDPMSEFYLCGKPEIVKDITDKLKLMGFAKIYSEKF